MALTTEAHLPADQKQLAPACLEGEDHLLWKMEFYERCQHTAELNAIANNPVTYDMLAREGQYSNVWNQLLYNHGIYAPIGAATRRAWNALPTTVYLSHVISKICQGPDELFQEFIDSLTTVDRSFWRC